MNYKEQLSPLRTWRVEWIIHIIALTDSPAQPKPDVCWTTDGTDWAWWRAILSRASTQHTEPEPLTQCLRQPESGVFVAEVEILPASTPPYVNISKHVSGDWWAEMNQQLGTHFVKDENLPDSAPWQQERTLTDTSYHFNQMGLYSINLTIWSTSLCANYKHNCLIVCFYCKTFHCSQLKMTTAYVKRALECCGKLHNVFFFLLLLHGWN